MLPISLFSPPYFYVSVLLSFFSPFSFSPKNFLHISFVFFSFYLPSWKASQMDMKSWIKYTSKTSRISLAKSLILLNGCTFFHFLIKLIKLICIFGSVTSLKTTMSFYQSFYLCLLVGQYSVSITFKKWTCTCLYWCIAMTPPSSPTSPASTALSKK